MDRQDPTPLEGKSSIEEIRNRFDRDVERFSSLESGQRTTVDAPLAMELITRAAVATVPHMQQVLDIGCGAGNNSLKLLELRPGANCDLVDLSQAMLERACKRVTLATTGRVRTFQGDLRTLPLKQQGYDVILAAAVLHHLRDDRDWLSTFRRLYQITAPGGALWITDLVAHESGTVNDLMWHRYGEYLKKLGGRAYRDKVFSYIDREDSPRPVTYQLELLRQVGFSTVDLLHKNSCFAAFGAVKA